MNTSSAARARPDRARQQRERAAATHLPEVEMGVTDARRPRGEREVAVEEQLETAGSRDAVHERDRRHGQRAQPAEDPVELRDETAGTARVALQRLVADQVAAGRERTAVAGDEDATHRGVGHDVVEGAVERVEHVASRWR